VNEQFAQKTTLGCIGSRQVCDQRELDNIEFCFSGMPDSPEWVGVKTSHERSQHEEGTLKPRRHCSGGRLRCALTKTET